MTLLTIRIIKACNRPFLSSPRPLYQNKVKCSAFDMEMIFHSHANKIHFHKKGCTLGLVLKVRVFGTWKWPIVINCQWSFPCRKYRSFINNVKVMKVAKVPPGFLYCLDPSKTLLLLQDYQAPRWYSLPDGTTSAHVNSKCYWSAKSGVIAGSICWWVDDGKPRITITTEKDCISNNKVKKSPTTCIPSLANCFPSNPAKGNE